MIACSWNLNVVSVNAFDRELKLFWLLKLQPCLQRCCRKADYEEMEGLQPTPEHWEIEFDKQDLGDFTLAEYMEKVILYGLLMVIVSRSSSLSVRLSVSH